VHNRTSSPGPRISHPLRAAVITPAVIAVVLASGGIAGAAESGSAPVEADLTTFGLLGPVGLAAVALGIIGMALGVLRQRRKSQAATEAPNQPAEPPAVAADSDEPTLTPYRRSA
jgi:hypothetical protein